MIKFLIMISVLSTLTGCAGTVFTTGSGGRAIVNVPLYTPLGRTCNIGATRFDKTRINLTCFN